MKTINLLKLCTTIKCLHTTGIYASQPIASIASSKHVREYRFDKTNSIFMHLGFSFRLQSGNEFEIYYDLTNNIMVRQSRYENIPMILGLICHFKGEYINAFDLKIIKNIDLKKGTYNIFEAADQTELMNIGNFEIVDSSCTFSLSSLSRLYSEPLYYYENNFYTSKDYKQIKKEERLDREMWEDARREMDSWDRDFPGWKGDR
jgi:hypothetical protein